MLELKGSSYYIMQQCFCSQLTFIVSVDKLRKLGKWSGRNWPSLLSKSVPNDCFIIAKVFTLLVDSYKTEEDIKAFKLLYFVSITLDLQHVPITIAIVPI